MVADEEADHRHVGLGNADGAKLREFHLAVDLDGAIEGERCVRIEAGRLEGLVGEIGAIGRQRHVGEPAARLQPLPPFGVEFGVLDDAQDLEIVGVEDHEVIGRTELLVKAARLDLKAEPGIGRLGGIDAVDHHHDMVEALDGARHAGLRRTMLIPLAVITSSPF